MDIVILLRQNMETKVLRLLNRLLNSGEMWEVTTSLDQANRGLGQLNPTHVFIQRGANGAETLKANASTLGVQQINTFDTLGELEALIGPST